MSTITQVISQYAASTSYEAIPSEAVERAKQVILDELGAATFGSQRTAGELGARYALSAGGPAESSILGTSARVPASFAALANGTAGHAEEVDGVHLVGGHPGATIVHAALAMAQRQRASGSELINAVVLGYDVGIRMAYACGSVFRVKDKFGLHADFLFALGGTAAAGRLLKLDAAQLAHALALVTFQVNGLCALFDERRHISKAFCNGQYAFASVSAALQAAAGLEGSDDIIGGRYGVLGAWGIENGEDIASKALGSDFSIMGANFKFANAGYPIHTPVEAALTVVRENSIRLDSIASIHIGMASNALRVVDNRQMHNICVQDMVSAALLTGGLSLCDSPFPAVLSNPAFAPLRARIQTSVDPEIERDLPNGRAAKVTITTADGKQHRHRIDWPKGHCNRGGLTWAELGDKWRNGLPGLDIDEAIRVTRDLEAVDDVSTLTAAFVLPTH